MSDYHGFLLPADRLFTDLASWMVFVALAVFWIGIGLAYFRTRLRTLTFIQAAGGPTQAQAKPAPLREAS